MTPAGFERWRQNFADIVENLVGRRLDYAVSYPAVVVEQNSDGSLQLLVDDPRMRGTGQNNIPIRHGLPGVSVEVAQGARVRLGFEGGDPSLPYASLWDTQAAMVTITLGSVAGSEFVALSNLVKDELDAFADIFNAHIHVTTATVGATAVPGVIAPPAAPQAAGEVAATKVKAE